MSEPQKRALCPSSVCVPGAVLLGIVMPDGRVAFAHDRIQIDEEFVTAAREAGDPERRFRFSGRCVQSGCGMWTGSRCGVIDEVLEVVPERDRDPVGALPECAIRTDCRWFSQVGVEACRVCPQVITDTRSEATAVD